MFVVGTHYIILLMLLIAIKDRPFPHHNFEQKRNSVTTTFYSRRSFHFLFELFPCVPAPLLMKVANFDSNFCHTVNINILKYLVPYRGKRGNCPYHDSNPGFFDVDSHL